MKGQRFGTLRQAAGRRLGYEGPIVPPRVLKAMRVGVQAASPAERAAFGALASFSITIGVSRTVNYVRERRRKWPLMRSLLRRALAAPGPNSVRVHHFLPGIGLAFAAGAVAIATHKNGWDWLLSVPFGSGAALTLDELALLVGRDDAYWDSERLALAQSVITGVAAVGLAVRFRHRGEVALSTLDPSGTGVS